MAAFTPSGSGGIPITANIPGVINPTIANVTITLANTEYSYALPGDTKKFMVKFREGNASLKLSFVSGQSGTVYTTIPPGCFAYEGDIQASVLTLYFQSTQAAQILEITSWV